MKKYENPKIDVVELTIDEIILASDIKTVTFNDLMNGANEGFDW